MSMSGRWRFSPMIDLKAQMGETLFPHLIEKDESPRVKVLAAGGLANLGQPQEVLLEYCIQAAMGS